MIEFGVGITLFYTLMCFYYKRWSSFLEAIVVKRSRSMIVKNSNFLVSHLKIEDS